MNAYLRFLLKMKGGFQYMLWLASILCFVVFGLSKSTDMQTLGLAIVLILVIVITGGFEFY
jgi:hypothetical protein